MRLADAIEWLEELIREARSFQTRPSAPNVFGPEFYSDRGDPLAWLARAGSAVEAIFPPGHSIKRNWEKSVSQNDRVENVDGAVSLIRAAHRLAQSGRLRSLVDGVRAETVVQVLDQATTLANAGHGVAATVLAGGALETHLRHLCDRANLLSSLTGHGSITKYTGLMAQARKSGDEILSKADESQAQTWGKYRNDAAHDPTNFDRSTDATALMIEGIRQFIARNA